MQKQISVIALTFAVTLVGCAKDGGSNNNNNRDMTVAPKRDLSEPEAPADLRRVRDFSDPVGEDLAVDPNADMLVDPNADMAVDPNADMLVDPNADMVVDPSADMLVDPSADMLVDPSADMLVDPNADMLVNPNADMLVPADMTAPPTCVATPTFQVTNGSFFDLDFSTDGDSTVLSLPLGFEVSGRVTWPKGYLNIEDENAFLGGSITYVNVATGDSFNYFAADFADGPADDWEFDYILHLPAGVYDVYTAIGAVTSNNAEVYSTNKTTVTVCGDVANRNISHSSLDVVLRNRTFKVSGLAPTYDSVALDTRFDALATFETPDGNLRIRKYFSTFDGTGADGDVINFDTFPLPRNVSAPVPMQPSLTVFAYSNQATRANATNGWTHTFRFPQTNVVSGAINTNAIAAASFVVSPTDVVTLSGAVTDTNAKLTRVFDTFGAFETDINYISHVVNCLGAADTFVRRSNTADLFTDALGYSTPVQKGLSCSVAPVYNVRVPLVDNVGTPPDAPFTDTWENDHVLLTSTAESIAMTANATRSFDVPNLTAESLQIVEVRDANGVGMQDLTVTASSQSTLNGQPGFFAQGVATTDADGFVILNLLAGEYYIVVSGL